MHTSNHPIIQDIKSFSVMKKTAAILATLMLVAILLGACRTRELCPAYQSKANIHTEKRS
jgi:hypothetical protein